MNLIFENIRHDFALTVGVGFVERRSEMIFCYVYVKLLSDSL